MNILYQCDDNYAPFCGVSVTSLFENNKDLDTINVYILDDDISDANKQKFMATAEKYCRNISFVDCSKVLSFLKEKKATQYRGAYTIWLKLFCVSLLGITEGNLIYIDSDTTVVGSIRELDTMDLGEYCCAMVEAFEGFDYKRMISKENLTYYYSAVIVFNMPVYKKMNCEKIIMEKISNSQTQYPFPEQDLFLILFHDNILKIPPQYDYAYVYEATVSLKYAKKILSWSNDFYNEVVQASKQLAICHCAPIYGKRPWDEGAFDSQIAKWNYYLAISEWKDYKKNKKKTSIVNTFQIMLYKLLPMSLYCIVHRMAYLYLTRKAAALWKEK